MLHLHIKKIKASMLPYNIIQRNPIINLKKDYWVVYEFPDHENPPHARRKDKVQWHFFGRAGAKVYIQFPSDKLLEKSNGIRVDGFVLSANMHITLTVQKQAPRGRHYYAAFITPDNKFAIAGSPPVIIIE